jgi:cytochrome d ubiquinol oxidase subunit I
MPISALGIYIHAFFLSLSLGLPLVIGALLYKWWRSGDEDCFRLAKMTTAVLALNFTLGAITGTLVEFGLVQGWPGSIFVIATFGLVPLSLELVAFAAEIVFLLWFVISLGKVKPKYSLALICIYFVFAAISGVLITAVNSWLNVPWGTGGVASSIYPFLPEYGPTVVDPQAFFKVKLALINGILAQGYPAQIIQDPNVARSIGLTLTDPSVALSSPYALASAIHNVTAGTIVGVTIALASFGYKFCRTGSQKYYKAIRVILPLLLIMVVLQPTLFGDMMGKAVATYDPTKFALMEGAKNDVVNPILGFLSYGDPNHPILGFATFRNLTESLRGTTLGQLAWTVVPGYDPGAAGSLDLAAVSLTDLTRAESNMSFVNLAYYIKIVWGVVDLVSVLMLTVLVFNLPLLSRSIRRRLEPFGKRRVVMLFCVMLAIASISASSLGWAVREVGRKPWTVYGLIHPEDVVTPVPLDATVMVAFVGVFVTMAIAGVYGMYVLAVRPSRFGRSSGKREGS